MLGLTFTGDIHGCSNRYSPSIKGHLRPLASDFGARIVFYSSVLDNERTNIGKTGNDGVFLPFQLPNT
jgi:hypothetical protein